eukprot:1218257-Amphidinium_carterae.1
MTWSHNDKLAMFGRRGTDEKGTRNSLFVPGSRWALLHRGRRLVGQKWYLPSNPYVCVDVQDACASYCFFILYVTKLGTCKLAWSCTHAMQS